MDEAKWDDEITWTVENQPLSSWMLSELVRKLDDDTDGLVGVVGVCPEPGGSLLCMEGGGGCTASDLIDAIVGDGEDDWHYCYGRAPQGAVGRLPEFQGW